MSMGGAWLEQATSCKERALFCAVLWPVAQSPWIGFTRRLSRGFCCGLLRFAASMPLPPEPQTLAFM